MVAANAMRTISGAIWSCSRIMNMAITMTIAGTTVATTLPVGVSPSTLATTAPTAPAISAATTKIRIATMMFGR
jgi:hypothetical protein